MKLYNLESYQDLLAEFHRPGAFPSCDPGVVDYLDAFARNLISSRQDRAVPELFSVSEFFRKSNILTMIEKENSHRRVGVGRCFHITPNNMVANFAFSFGLSLLSGNKSVVKIPRTASESREKLIRAFTETAGGYSNPLIANSGLIDFPSEHTHVTSAFIEHADANVWWGSDSTIAELSAFRRRPSSRILSFPGRTSSAVINLGYATTSEVNLLADRFIEDTLRFDQAACSSPRLVFFPTSDHDSGRVTNFFKTVDERYSRHLVVEPDQRVRRLNSLALVLLNFDYLNVEQMKHLDLITLEPDYQRLGISAAPFGMASGGIFTAVGYRSLDEICEFLPPENQTLTTFGISEEQLANTFRYCPQVLRLVPVGSALKFDNVWDGTNLLQSLSRPVPI